MAKIKGKNKPDYLEGTNNNDLILGLGGDDTIWGRDGNDNIDAGDGDDSIYLSGNKDTINGGKGFDMLICSYVSEAIVIDMNTHKSSFVTFGIASSVKFKSIEGVYGTNFGDTITGDKGNNDIFSVAGNDTVFGGAGNDYINAYTGDDLIDGGLGNDTLLVSAGTDTFAGGKGADRLNFYFATSGVTVAVTDASVNYNTSAGLGMTTFSSVEDLEGGIYGDNLTGNSAANVLRGDLGDDTLFGLEGKDVLIGDNDNTAENAGVDTLNGGADRDAFVFTKPPASSTQADIIEDFENHIDVLWFEDRSFGLKGTGARETYLGFKIQHLAASQFQSGEDSVAGNTKVRLIYETDTGTLYHDANGSKAGGLTEVAHLDAGLELRARDFFVF